MNTDYREIQSDQKISRAFKKRNIKSFNEALKMVKLLPYGRNKNRYDPEEVLIEGRGTCSSKHALIKQLATENQWEEVHLVLAIFKMNAINTPVIGPVLEKAHLDFIPEAHCYLNIQGGRIDITNENSDFKKLEKDIIEEQFISTEQVSEYKALYHQKYLKNWISKSKQEISFPQLWKIREDCINKLSYGS